MVVLGPVGHNLGAGMTGGEAFIHDPVGRLSGRLNRGLVDAVRPGSADLRRLRTLIERHHEVTESEVARTLLAAWDESSSQFWRVVPVREVARIEGTGETLIAAST